VFEKTFGVASILAILAALGACAPRGHVPAPSPRRDAVATPSLARVTVLPLAPPLDEARAELSGLGWYGDDLVLLPQFPDRFPTIRGGAAFAIKKGALREAIRSGDPKALVPAVVPFETGDLERQIEGFDGFESIAFDGDRVFLTIEARRRGGTVGYIVRGKVADGLRIVLDPTSLVMLTPPVSISNVGFEALTVHAGSLLAFFEANGSAIVTRPIVRRFTMDLVELPALPLAAIDYRITAATSVDAAERLWVINYYWPGEPALARASDDAHARSVPVEQLVELVIHDGRIERSGRAPVRLAPDSRGRARNWEGLVRFEDRGFLIVTDEHPETMLAFVDAPGERFTPDAAAP
jgi:hypothetical protein